MSQGCFEGAYHESVSDLFDKKFTFSRQNHWDLPETAVLFTQKPVQDAQLQELKLRLNGVKSKLNDYDISVWSIHTSNNHPGSVVIRGVRETFQAEFVTQAWTKFYECLGSFTLISETLNRPLNTVHLCEAPGAFVVALNHFLVTQRQIDPWRWCATTLNVYYEGNVFGSMISDDRFILNTLENWEFGADNTGDITNRRNVDQLVRRCKGMGEIHLVTADGSVNCINTPECQEEVVSFLHYAETVAALRILTIGGNFVLKMFTFFESSSICLLYLLVASFKSVSVFKPVTSKGGNSEVYVICEDLVECPSEEFLEKMFNNMTNTEESLFPTSELPEDFMEELRKCAEVFTGYQIEVIERNIATFRPEMVRKIPFEVEQMKQAVLLEFCHRYRLEILPEAHRIASHKNDLSFWRDTPKINEGTYNDRMAPKSHLEIRQYHWKKYKWYQDKVFCSHRPDLKANTFSGLHPICGKRFKKLTWSIFVAGGLHHNFLETIRDCVALPEHPDNSYCRTDKKSHVALIEMIAFYKITDHMKYLRETMMELRKILQCSDVKKIVLINFCPLSQVAAGLLFLLAHEKHSRIQLRCRQGEISITLRDDHIKQIYGDIVEKIENLLNSEDTESILLSIVDIPDVYRNNNFNRSLRCFNNHLVMKMIREILSHPTL
ncbi:Cap-specific mRNA (nucleoside-2'-O-)-methyltransferase 2 [Sergentomyia squamirostris]